MRRVFTALLIFCLHWGIIRLSGTRNESSGNCLKNRRFSRRSKKYYILVVTKINSINTFLIPSLWCIEGPYKRWWSKRLSVGKWRGIYRDFAPFCSHQESFDVWRKFSSFHPKQTSKNQTFPLLAGLGSSLSSPWWYKFQRVPNCFPEQCFLADFFPLPRDGTSVFVWMCAYGILVVNRFSRRNKKNLPHNSLFCTFGTSGNRSPVLCSFCVLIPLWHSLGYPKLFWLFKRE